MAPNPSSEKMKGAEGILADVFDHSAIGLAIFDDRLRYRALNSGLAAMHGIPAESHFGKTLREILGAVASRVEPAVKQVFTTGRPILNLEITGVLPTRAGRRRWVDHLFPLKDATGRVKQVGVVVVEHAAGESPRPTGSSDRDLTALSDSEVLRSWKEIASHMGACVRTVQRWEQIYKLPIRRLAVKKGAMVFALRSEVDRWIRKGTRRTKSRLKDKHLRAMFLNCPLPALIVENDRVIVDANIAVADLIGRTRIDLIGRTLDSLGYNSTRDYNEREWGLFQKAGVSVGLRNIWRADGTVFAAEYILKNLFPGLHILTLTSVRPEPVSKREVFYEAGRGKLELHREIS
jgi:PAS domain S-box-containing protein